MSLTLALAASALVAAGVRTALAFREVRALADSREPALTDDLTWLSNRRRLMRDLEHVFADGDAWTLTMFDLDGLKEYNDIFGHPEGDLLLRRLAARLAAAVEPGGHAYRLGGDEFCTLVPDTADHPATELAAALEEDGHGFSVASSSGSVRVPTEGGDAPGALKLADRRLHDEKELRPGSVPRQMRELLLRILQEQDPGLHAHAREVKTLSLAVGHKLGMPMRDLDDLLRTAEFHDIGKIAIPDAILNKPGPLDDEEWAFMRRHTLIGARILGVAPALASVARLVRSTHERWDGRGYPDGLAGEAIPLGARIVAVCDAFDAMISEGPYKAVLRRDDAIAEIRRYAGSQFDPTVVRAFCEAVSELDAELAEAA